MAYGSTLRGKLKKGRLFWNDLEKVVDRVVNRDRLCVLRYLNGWVRDSLRTCITHEFAVQEENYNGRKVTDFCSERGLCMGNTYFEHKGLPTYNRMARGHDDSILISMIDLVLVKKDMLHYVKNVRIVRGIRSEL